MYFVKYFNRFGKKYSKLSLIRLPLILINPEVVVYKVSSAQVFHKLLVMCYDYKLKVPLLLPGSNDSVEQNVNCLNVSVTGIAGQNDIAAYTIGKLGKQFDNSHGKKQMSSIVRVKLLFKGLKNQTM